MTPGGPEREAGACAPSRRSRAAACSAKAAKHRSNKHSMGLPGLCCSHLSDATEGPGQPQPCQRRAAQLTRHASVAQPQAVEQRRHALPAVAAAGQAVHQQQERYAQQRLQRRMQPTKQLCCETLRAWPERYLTLRSARDHRLSAMSEQHSTPLLPESAQQITLSLELLERRHNVLRGQLLTANLQHKWRCKHAGRPERGRHRLCRWHSGSCGRCAGWHPSGPQQRTCLRNSTAQSAPRSAALRLPSPAGGKLLTRFCAALCRGLGSGRVCQSGHDAEWVPLLLATRQPQPGHLARQGTHGGEAVGALCSTDRDARAGAASAAEKGSCAQRPPGHCETAPPEQTAVVHSRRVLFRVQACARRADRALQAAESVRGPWGSRLPGGCSLTPVVVAARRDRA